VAAGELQASSRRPLSVCIITRDEERNVAACLESVAFADEILVVDSESTDRTREIAAAHGARVIVQPFLGHVQQKQFAVDRASHDLVLCLDADERVDAVLARAIEDARSAAGDGAIAGYAVNRHTHHLGGFVDHGGWFPEWRVRLFDRRRGRWTGTDPHDRVEVDGAVRKLPGELLHYAYRDLSHHVAKIDSYTTIMAARRDERGERASLAKLVLRPPARFVRMYLLRGGFRDGTRGFVIAAMGAFYVFLKYAKLWERQRALR
jgi:glycosyltransferase involved in cell wall biosynthesis